MLHLETQHEIEKTHIKEEAEDIKDNSLDSDNNTHIKHEPIGVKEEEYNSMKVDLYPDHEIKEEMVIGPVVLQHSSLAQVTNVQQWSDQVKRPRQPMSVHEKKMVTDVYKYINKTWPPNEYWSLTNVKNKTAEILGISAGTVYRIIKDSKTDREFRPPRKPRQRTGSTNTTPPGPLPPIQSVATTSTIDDVEIEAVDGFRVNQTPVSSVVYTHRTHVRSEELRHAIVQSNIDFKEKQLEMMTVEHKYNIKIAELKIKKIELEIAFLEQKVKTSSEK